MAWSCSIFHTDCMHCHHQYILLCVNRQHHQANVHIRQNTPQAEVQVSTWSESLQFKDLVFVTKAFLTLFHICILDTSDL